MFRLNEEIAKLLEKYPDPREGGIGLYKDEQRKLRAAAPPRYGVVADNKDPQCLGRVRVACDMIAPGAVTDWIPMVSRGAGNGSGWWQLPDIGT
ncbi:MAG: phage baseplate assembly protein V, partial [Treponema sp.]|nr:phage baseplate assembly protein V [Treponema sp.]